VQLVVARVFNLSKESSSQTWGAGACALIGCEVRQAQTTWKVEAAVLAEAGDDFRESRLESRAHPDIGRLEWIGRVIEIIPQEEVAMRDLCEYSSRNFSRSLRG
jgi:hypothetical protein